MQVVKGKGDNVHQYFEENNTMRNITTFEWDKKIGGKNRLQLSKAFHF